MRLFAGLIIAVMLTGCADFQQPMQQPATRTKVRVVYIVRHEPPVKPAAPMKVTPTVEPGPKIVEPGPTTTVFVDRPVPIPVPVPVPGQTIRVSCPTDEQIKTAMIEASKTQYRKSHTGNCGCLVEPAKCSKYASKTRPYCVSNDISEDALKDVRKKMIVPAECKN